MLKTLIIATMLASTVSVGTADARAVSSTLSMREAGVLTCTMSPGVGLVFGSSRTAGCVFDHAGIRPFSETYLGQFSRAGLDLGFSGPQVVSWTVYTPGGRANPGMLRGLHEGSSAEAQVLAGSGAAIDLDVGAKHLIFEPRALSGTVGFGFGIGSSELALEPARFGIFF